MATLYLFVDNATNIIQHAQYAQPSTAPNGQTVFSLDDSVANVLQTLANPTNYLYSNGSIIQRPYFTVGYANGTLTATLNAALSPHPASVTFAVAGQTFSAPLNSGKAILALNTHPSMLSQQVSVTVSASGCVDETVNIGGTGTQVALQVYTPPSGTPTVVPSGMGSQAFLQAYYALTPASLMKLLGDIGTAVNLLCDTVYGELVPAAQQTTWAPITLDPDQLNAIGDIKSNILPHLFTTLKNAYPTGGMRQRQFNDFSTDMAKSFVAYQNYENDLATIPNLA